MPCVYCEGGVIICNSNPECPLPRHALMSAALTESEQPTLVGTFSLAFYSVQEESRTVHLLGFESGTGNLIARSGEWEKGQTGWPGLMFSACEAYEVADLEALRSAIGAGPWNEIPKKRIEKGKVPEAALDTAD